MLWIKRPSLDGSRDPGKVNEYGAGLASFLSYLYQPKFGSSEQFIQLIVDQFEEFDNKFFVPHIGITVRQCVDISLAIVEKVRTQSEEYIKNFSVTMRPILENWKQFRNGLITLEEAKRKHEPIAQELMEGDLFEFMSCFVVSKEDFASLFSDSVRQCNEFSVK